MTSYHSYGKSQISSSISSSFIETLPSFIRLFIVSHFSKPNPFRISLGASEIILRNSCSELGMCSNSRLTRRSNGGIKIWASSPIFSLSHCIKSVFNVRLKVFMVIKIKFSALSSPPSNCLVRLLWWY